MANYLKTGILLAALTALLIGFGYLVGGTQGATVFLVISLLINLVSYWFSDKIALSMARAKPLSEAQAPQLYADVKQISKKMGMPAPRIYITDNSQPNAFATGRNPENSAVAVTTGLMQLLDEDEVMGVLAHEMSHIKNRDVLIATIAAVIAGTISSLANIALWTGGGRSRNNGLASLLLVILAPIAAMIIQLAVSRSREYAADATAASYTGKPKSLANALLKIDEAGKKIPMNVNPAMSSLYISNPLSGKNLAGLFSTHPPIGERVARLEAM